MDTRLRLSLPWIGGCAGLAAVSVLVFLHDVLLGGAAAWAPHLEWWAAEAWREPWRAWTAVVVHRDLAHLGANLAGCAVVAWFGWAGRLPVRAAWAACAAWPLTQLLLWAIPGLTRYAGLSGVLHAAVAVASVALIAEARGHQRGIGAMVWVGLLIKVLLEAPWAGAVQTLPGWDFPVAVAAHATGLISGTLIMGLVAALHVRHTARASLPRQ